MANRSSSSKARAGDPATYLRIISAQGLAVDAWETTYIHVLDPEGESDNPVLDWVTGTGLKPMLDVLDDGEEQEEFIATYAEKVKEAYPRTPAGVLLPFRRVFAVGRKG